MNTPEAEVYRALERVYDTCSLFNGTNLNIVEMGLIRGVERQGDHVHIRLLLSDPMCVYFFEIVRRIEEELTALPGIRRVTVENTTDILWTPERISPAAQARLAERRARRLAELPQAVRERILQTPSRSEP